MADRDYGPGPGHRISRYMYEPIGNKMMIRRKAFEFVEEVRRISSIDEIMNAMGSVLKQCGIENYLFSFIATPTETFEDVILASRISAELLKVYTEKGYVHDDPGFRYCQTTLRPFRWFADSPYDPEREPRAAEVVQFCRDFGLVDGVVIPFASPTRRLGQVWFGGQPFDLPDEELPALHLMALYAFDRVLEIKGRSDQMSSVLSPREREVLTLVAAGKTGEEIGELLNITARTVVEHIKHCCRKLGAATRTQAVVIAMRHRLIQP